ncbi:MAG TPA: penicillin-insensitive murein endopeptidase [Solirubrobacterales bacterium]|nr:penicillin-insensitive murein endopeptidase [Solirubrobacterales bacterium]
MISALAVLCGVALLLASELDSRGGEASRRSGAARPPTATADPSTRVRPDPSDRREPAKRGPRIRWRDSVAVGTPEDGSLVRGVRLPAEGRSYFTWDPVLKRRPDRDWRRWGTDDTVRTLLRVIRGYREEHPNAPRVGVGDLSLPRGGYFGPEVSGGIGHATHQNGLNVDVYYPRLDGRERPPTSVDQIELPLAQDLVDRFVRAGAVRIFVGPSTPLTGPPGVVTPLISHDNHLHVVIGP